MTKNELETYRKMRKNWLLHGRRAFTPEEWAEYNRMRGEVGDWLSNELRDPGLRGVAYWYYHQGYGTEAVSFKVHYSERQVRRIRRQILALVDAGKE